MKSRDFIRAISFCIIFCALFMLCEKIFFSRNEICSTWEKVQNVDNVDVLVMGSSRAFTSIDADAMSQALGLDVEILGSSSQYMVQTLNNLKVVLDYQNPRLIVLEAYSIFSDGEELRQEKKGMIFQNSDGIENYFRKFQSLSNILDWKDIPSGMFQLLRSTNTWSRFSDFKDREEYISDANGYRARAKYARLVTDMENVQEAYNIKYAESEVEKLPPDNVYALKEFLTLTEKKGIDVWIYKSPTTVSQEASFMRAVEQICSDYGNVSYIDDLNKVAADIGISSGDWYDSGHLNRSGAEKVTVYYGNLMAERFGIDADWDRPFAYRTENVVKNADGKYSYTMENYSKDCLFQFELYSDGELIDVQDYSENNTYVCEYDVRTDAQMKLYCSMIPSDDAELGDRSENRIYISFMSQNDCVIE